MQQIRRHAALGWRWIRCGWRLFRRNSWLLGGMGFCCCAFTAALVNIPFAGGPFLGLLAPSLIASFYIAIDGVSKQKMTLPPALRLAAIKQSPREFMNVARQDARLMQVLVLGLYGLVAVVLTDVAVWLVAGVASTSPLASLSAAALLSVLAGMLLRLIIYLLLAASLVFTVPLALFQKQALIPALVDSFRHALHHGVALLAVVGFPLASLLPALLASLFSPWLGYILGIAIGSATLPIFFASLYCSYRTLFTAAEPVRHLNADIKRANYVSS